MLLESIFKALSVFAAVSREVVLVGLNNVVVVVCCGLLIC